MGTQIFVNTNSTSGYPIYISDSWEDLKRTLVQGRFSNKKICLVTDSNVYAYYANELQQLIQEHSQACIIFTFPAGEASKTLDTVRKLYHTLIDNHFERNDCLFALGGGVVGDLTGYTAATYLRGIDFYQVPTSLLAMVDSSVGGKTGVDFDGLKNMVGAFKQPSSVFMNLEVLKTLPKEQVASGMGEVIKYGLIRNASFYQFIIQHIDCIRSLEYSTIETIVTQSCTEKKLIVEEDPTEQGIRALLNYGHTLGHAIEKQSQFLYSHGACVALGMLCAMEISQKRNEISQQQIDELKRVLLDFELPITIPEHLIQQWSSIVDSTKNDKKMSLGQIRFVLLRQIGEAYIDQTVTDKEMNQCVSVLQG